MGIKLKAEILGLCVASLCSIWLAPSACLAMGTTEQPEKEQADPDYTAAKIAMGNKDWNAAVKSLLLAAQHDPKNADIQNFLGYSNRKLGNYDLAFKHYGMALELNPKHRGAHEYIGETYLLVNNPAKAEEHLAALKKICFVPCAESRELTKAIAAYKQKGPNKQAAGGADSNAY
jgi:tetratricopeptide (TPR) repeat protein